MASFKKGDGVRLKQPVVQGSVLDTRYNKDAECLEHLLEYKDKKSGETHQRWFLETDLEASRA